MYVNLIIKLKTMFGIKEQCEHSLQPLKSKWSYWEPYSSVVRKGNSVSYRCTKCGKYFT